MHVFLILSGPENKEFSEWSEWSQWKTCENVTGGCADRNATYVREETKNPNLSHNVQNESFRRRSCQVPGMCMGKYEENSTPMWSQW